MNRPLVRFFSAASLVLGAFALVLACDTGHAHAFFGVPDGAIGGTLGALGVTSLLALGAIVLPSIDESLSLCHRCPLNSIPRSFSLLDRMDQSRAAPGLTSHVDFGGREAKIEGKVAYVRALKIAGFVRLTLGAANEAYTAYQLRSLFREIFLSDWAGHEYYTAGIDGRNVVDDSWFRAARLPEPLDGAVALNQGAGVHDHRIDLLFDFVSRRPGASQYEGLIPLAMLQKRGPNAMTFRCGTTADLAQNTGGAAPPAGFTVTSYLRDDGSAGLDILADIVYLPEEEVVDGGCWAVRNQLYANANTDLDYPEARHEYAMQRFMPEDAFNAGTNGQQQAATISGVQLAVNGRSTDSMTTLEMRRYTAEYERSSPESAASLNLPGLGIPTEPGVTVPYLALLARTDQIAAPSGRVNMRQQTRPGTNTRILHRVWFCPSEKRLKKIAEATGLGPSCGCMQPTPNGMVAGTPNSAGPVILRKQ